MSNISETSSIPEDTALDPSKEPALKSVLMVRYPSGESDSVIGLRADECVAAFAALREGRDFEFSAGGYRHRVNMKQVARLSWGFESNDQVEGVKESVND